MTRSVTMHSLLDVALERCAGAGVDAQRLFTGDDVFCDDAFPFL